jgi:hypothetical protein
MAPDWQEEKPPAPSYLRVLYLGKMLLDDDTLTSTPAIVFENFLGLIICIAELKIPSSMPNTPHPTIVHLSIRPSNYPGEDGTMKKKRKNSDGAPLSSLPIVLPANLMAYYHSAT